MFADEIISRMKSMQNEEQRRILSGFFKTGEGEYGAGDVFLGIKVPQSYLIILTRDVCSGYSSLDKSGTPTFQECGNDILRESLSADVGAHPEMTRTLIFGITGAFADSRKPGEGLATVRTGQVHLRFRDKKTNT